MEQELRDIEARIAQAIVAGDVAFVERVWADDFAYTGVRGELRTKADILADLRSGTLKFARMEFDDIRVHLHADAAVVTGQATTEGQSPLGPISGVFRYTRVYVRKSGQWRLVAFQGTPTAS